MKKYVHYSRRGVNKFDRNMFIPVKNEPMRNKPSGCFWGSPVDTDMNWEHWCKNNDFATSSLREENKIVFTLTEDAKVLTIKSVNDLKDLPKLKTLMGMEKFYTYLDFEEISKSYDAIELLLSEEEIDFSNHKITGLYYELYGWDCDTILVMNPDVIIEEGR